MSKKHLSLISSSSFQTLLFSSIFRPSFWVNLVVLLAYHLTLFNWCNFWYLLSFLFAWIYGVQFGLFALRSVLRFLSYILDFFFMTVALTFIITLTLWINIIIRVTILRIARVITWRVIIYTWAIAFMILLRFLFWFFIF